MRVDGLGSDDLARQISVQVQRPIQLGGGFETGIATLSRMRLAFFDPEDDTGFCVLGGKAWGGGRTLFATWSRDADAASGTPYEDAWYVDDDLRIGAATVPAYAIERPLSVPQPYLISQTTIAVEVQPSAWIEVREGSRLRVLRGPANPQRMFLVGHDVIWESWASDVVAIYRGNIDTDPTLLLYPADGSDLKGFATDGVDMAWTQSYEPQSTGPVPYARTELWAAHYTLDPGRIVARKVRDLDYRPVASQLVGQGYYAFRSPTGVQVVRLSDGQRRLLPANPNWRPVDVAWLTQGELAITVMRLETLGPLQMTLMRMPIDSIPLAL